MTPILIRPTDEHDRALIRGFITRRWHGEAIVAHGALFYPAELPGLIAIEDDAITGLVTYKILKPECEIITFDSIIECRGVGRQLLECVKKSAGEQGCTRIALITTNDNLPALRFYQKQGFTIKAVFADAMIKSRELKPSIPRLGFADIPIRDEIQLEMRLTT
jgi:GNAT superfamily N-acetyltransferase